jgi:pseudaminic acid biosynthesis-associated methylase
MDTPEKETDSLDRLDLWAGKFGDGYHERNRVHLITIEHRRRWLGQVLHPANRYHAVRSALEIGCGAGANLKALEGLCAGVNLKGLEPNDAAAEAAHKLASADIIVAGADQLPMLPADSEDLVLTCGLLIHIPPKGIFEVLQEMHRISKRFILMAEYFAPSEEEVPYRGKTAALWRRDYGSMLMQCTNATYTSHGFLWKPWDGMDNLVWWLFEKSKGEKS